ncbi:MAG: 2-C-methyl-D-erythritol 2,4-cyclodiphosphate synthase [Acidiferrobacteraceae bacterium]|jgi:2-C-methyl-D-erythritol 2,4-cyclodiphosphate synthase|nr:2-C-methyl-D-erythritol 2,4-cyclodiphosphate synthase [Acidiferrobacteraceae bacterium]MDP6122913.1 2-C-methyl-D-erythritol 2,4-cyclodiphosphate synthase [Arenicellales bacterium]MDP6434454.1 2-C-methyl-D-erythritol 2,4-cyclodiphosphate synthase [Arenicellales bacterium]MDP6671753.1 2-C-methyl-D-erythritol 2,4-cyclodiphosphate synthase [Arenicellales bacterium]MDP6723570.1 2-C-methyl-D-erythritol 2,4-cyclodiphosphate synthase [Arenicellales bacterium]|tara:strand:+ start:3384 stop:3860 length:477 start_codon:yes stop_codon:yes gene_type:complete
MRVGHGYDVHRLEQGRKLVLGGVEIEHEVGLAGHSDADVLLHAICDALLGGAGLGDIGHHFPDTNEQYSGIDSRLLLREVVKNVNDLGYRVSNLDATLVLQRPKVAAQLPLMKQNIITDLEVEPDRVNLKATTTEGLGAMGREEGVAAHAVVLLEGVG